MPRRKVGIVIGQLRREGYSCLDSLLSKVKFPGLLGGGEPIGLHVDAAPGGSAATREVNVVVSGVSVSVVFLGLA